MTKKIEHTFYLDTEEAGFTLGKQTGTWSGYEVAIKKQPLGKISEGHTMKGRLSPMPMGVRGIVTVDIDILPNCVIIYS